MTSLELDYLHFVEICRSPSALQATYSILTDITNFRFCALSDRSIDHLTHCVKLRQLTIEMRELYSPVQTIPTILEHLWIHYSKRGPRRWRQDTPLVETIRRLPNLKTLTMTAEHRFEEYEDTLAFEEVPEYCSRNGIELIMKFSSDLPPFSVWHSNLLTTCRLYHGGRRPLVINKI